MQKQKKSQLLEIQINKTIIVATLARKSHNIIVVIAYIIIKYLVYLYGYWGLSNVGPRRYKVSASLLIVLSFEFPSSSRASVGRWGYLRLCSDAQVSNLSQWESLIIWKNIPFSLSFSSFVCPLWAWALWVVSGSRHVLWSLGRVRWFPGI